LSFLEYLISRKLCCLFADRVAQCGWSVLPHPCSPIASCHAQLLLQFLCLSRRPRSKPTPPSGHCHLKMGAYSNDEVSKDSQSMSSKGSGGSKEGQYAAYTQNMCGAFSLYLKPENDNIFASTNVQDCRRPNHKELPQCSLYGYLFCLNKTKSKSMDGILESHTSPAVLQARQEEVFASHRTSL
jgi:hypothetical protein